MTPNSAPTPRRDFPTPAAGHRDWYAYEAVRALPRLILMVDKNPFSRTYGCFDRSFWHYRTMDFPCGMYQEYVLPLALAYKYPMPGNIYHGKERLKELALAGIRYAAKSSYANGSCDDYFPYERALGALVFSLYAMSEAYIELGAKDGAILDFFRLRGDWLCTHNESGQLANHQAFAALALYNVFLATGDEKYRKASAEFRDLTLSWQKPEGWFQEYEGADPGYHTCSIAFLAKLWQKSKDEKLVEPLRRAVHFARNFMHPDGSYAGEYGSRNTFHFYPHGFEVMTPLIPEAGEITEAFLHRAMPERRRYYNDDDRMAAHYVYDWMQAWRDYAPQRTPMRRAPEKLEASWLAEAQMLVVRTPSYHAVLAANKGGVFKATGADGPIASDTGPIGELRDGRVIVTHIVDKNEVTVDEAKATITVTGVFQERKVHLPTPIKMMIFRGLMLTIGRFNANLVRSMLQKKLIVGKARLPITFKRTVTFEEDAIVVRDEIESRQLRLTRLALGVDATSIYVANSNVFQDSTLLDWTTIDPAELGRLAESGRLAITRRIREGQDVTVRCE